jgi:hypothetical protein
VFGAKQQFINTDCVGKGWEKGNDLIEKRRAKKGRREEAK